MCTLEMPSFAFFCYTQWETAGSAPVHCLLLAVSDAVLAWFLGTRFKYSVVVLSCVLGDLGALEFFS